MDPIYDILDDSHPFSTQPLGKLGTEMRNKQSPTWRSIAHWPIGKTAFRDLRGPWKECNEFRIPRWKSNEQT